MADLFIRWSASNPADLGTRPISPCWPPNAVWTNVSIWMTYPPNHPAANTTALEARVGEQVIINVHASTRGATFPFSVPPEPEWVRCQIWVCTGANGVGPVSALASAGGPAGMTGLVLGTIDPLTPGLALALWTPAATDNLSFNAAGAAHVCLAANLVYPAATGATPPAQGQYLPQFMAAGQPVRTIFPCGDGPVDPRSGVPVGHFHGQRNIQVLDAAGTASMNVWGNGKKPHVLRLVERTGKGVLDAALREHLLAHPRVGLTGGRERKQRTLPLTPAMREVLDSPLRDVLRDSERLPLEPRERALIAGGGRLVLTADENVRLTPARTPLAGIAIEADNASGQSVEIVAGADDPKTLRVDLRAAGADKPGVYRVFDLVERDEKERLVGGTTFITLGGQ